MQGGDGEMAKPLLLALDSDAATLPVLERLLHNRYAINYEILCTQSPAAALAHLQACHRAGEQVAVLLIAQRLPGSSGVDFCAQAHRLYPDAKRVLLFDRSDLAATQSSIQAHWGAASTLASSPPVNSMRPFTN
jgi:thioredoxin reductase (NADPH)